MRKYDPSALQKFMEKYDIPEDGAIIFLDRFPEPLANALLQGRTITMVTAEEARQIEEAKRKGQPIPQELKDKLLHPGEDLVGKALAEMKVKKSR